VEETLQFAAMLRYRQTSVSSAVTEAVDRTMDILGLKDISDHVVGITGDSDISRGQLRRLTIGVEIVSNPSMIFLDEVSTAPSDTSPSAVSSTHLRSICLYMLESIAYHR
jgi:ABC-type multidrug transport system ATPase subunit